jgi:hypothetical protein
MLMVCPQFIGYPIVLQKFRCNTGILGQHQIGLFQDTHSPESDVFKIPYRRGDKV